MVFALLGALFAALMFVYLRIVGRSDPSVTTAIWYNATGVILAGVLTYIVSGFDPIMNLANSNSIYFLVGLGVVASFQQFFLGPEPSLHAEASTLAPRSPLLLIGLEWATAYSDTLDRDNYYEVPIIGTAIIIASTYYIFLREQLES